MSMYESYRRNMVIGLGRARKDPDVSNALSEFSEWIISTRLKLDLSISKLSILSGVDIEIIQLIEAGLHCLADEELAKLKKKDVQSLSETLMELSQQ